MRRLLLVALLVLAACQEAPVRDDVTVALGDDGQATITAVTEFELNPRSTAIRRRVDDARGAALAGTDAWSTRFARIEPDSESVTFERRRGQLERVTRIGRMPRSDIQQFFSDASLTIVIVDGDGWRELTIYPGTSSRASREQRERFARRMESWSGEVARYFTALHHLYSYLDGHPQRAKYVFAALFDDQALVTEDEEPFVSAVRDAMSVIAKRLEIEEGDAHSFAEEADLVFNPFPARLTIRLPGEVLESKGFAVKGRDAVVEPIDLLNAIAALEGQWVSPDPLAVALRTEDDPNVEELAATPRSSSAVVTAHEIESALRAKMRPPETYLVRWRG